MLEEYRFANSGARKNQRFVVEEASFEAKTKMSETSSLYTNLAVRKQS